MTPDRLRHLDAIDPLASFRERFDLPPGVIYLDGNSLGALPKDTAARVAAVVRHEWGEGLIRSWNDAGWMDLPQRVGDKIGRLVGAAPGQVVAADSTSVNLHKLLHAALDLAPGRRVILSDSGNFPTDLYIAQGVAGHRHATLRVVPPDEVAARIDDGVAVLMLTQVDYRTGRRHDMADLGRRAREAGVVTLWDLAHSAGAFPVELDACGADLAVGCGYKYLNGGPGAPAFLYVASRHQERISPPLSGWMGHAAPFAFDPDYRPAPGIRRQLCGTPAILGLAALEVGVDLALEADLADLRRKSVAMTEAFMALVEERLPGAFGVATPRDPEQRGSQVSLRHPAGHAIVQALIARGVIPDFRAPDILRFGFAPLYLRYAEVGEAVERLAEVMAGGAWKDPAYAKRAAVT